MESGLNLYYEGNTVIPPAPGMKRKFKTMNQQEAYLHTGKIMDFEPKVCATSRCIWCQSSFGDRYMVVCPRCRNCQYCGLSSVSMKSCAQCGNHLPEELNVGGDRIVAQAPSE